MSKAAAASDHVFESVGLKKEFDDGRVQALRGVDFRISEGEFVAIVGPSGSGKTTLLQMLGALDRPSAGTLSYRGESLFDLVDPATYRAQEIGFVFQAFHLLPTFTALENVQIPMFGREQSATARKTRAFELLKAVGLEHRVDHFPAKLSGGERQRVAIARSLANSPSVVLADEPTGNLDSKNSEIVLAMLRHSNRELGQTVLMITHNPEAASYGDRIIHMRDGEIVAPENDPQWAGHS